MSKLLALALIVSVGCSRPRRIVTEGTPLVYSRTLEAVREFETWLGCDVWRPVVYLGGARDWRGSLPPHGTITVHVADLENREGEARTAASGTRSRVRLRLAEVPTTVYLHELLHAMGEKHTPGGIMKAKGTPDMDRALAESDWDHYRRLCSSNQSGDLAWE